MDYNSKYRFVYFDETLVGEFADYVAALTYILAQNVQAGRFRIGCE